MTSPILGPERLSDLEDALTALDVVILRGRPRHDRRDRASGWDDLAVLQSDADQFRAHKAPRLDVGVHRSRNTRISVRASTEVNDTRILIREGRPRPDA